MGCCNLQISALNGSFDHCSSPLNILLSFHMTGSLTGHVTMGDRAATDNTKSIEFSRLQHPKT